MNRRRLASVTATTGVVAIISGILTACDETPIVAQCVIDENGQQTVVDDTYCTDHLSNDNGFFVWGGHQYRYYYGGNTGRGNRPGGGTYSPPEEDEDGYSRPVKTQSGKGITRGGLGGGKGGYGSGS